MFCYRSGSVDYGRVSCGGLRAFGRGSFPFRMIVSGGGSFGEVQFSKERRAEGTRAHSQCPLAILNSKVYYAIIKKSNRFAEESQGNVPSGTCEEINSRR